VLSGAKLVTAARRSGYLGRVVAVCEVGEVGAGLLAVGGVEDPNGGDLGGLLIHVLLHAHVEGVSHLAEVRSANPVSSRMRGTERRRRE
jgi:hypothetical protein